MTFKSACMLLDIDCIINMVDVVLVVDPVLVPLLVPLLSAN
jgi:hypothetical protein